MFVDKDTDLSILLLYCVDRLLTNVILLVRLAVPQSILQSMLWVYSGQFGPRVCSTAKHPTTPVLVFFGVIPLISCCSKGTVHIYMTLQYHTASYAVSSAVSSLDIPWSVQTLWLLRSKTPYHSCIALVFLEYH